MTRRSWGRQIADLKETQVRLLEQLAALGEQDGCPGGGADGPPDEVTVVELGDLTEIVDLVELDEPTQA